MSDSMTGRAGPSQRSLRRREALLGFLLIAPAVLVTAVFGLYPVVSGFAISLQGGVVLPEGFIGLSNYVAALGSLSYLLALVLALAFLAVAFRLFRSAFLVLHQQFYPLLAPGLLAALATLALLGALLTGLHQLDVAPLLMFALAAALYAILAARSPASAMDILRSWGTMLLTFSAVVLILFTFSELGSALSQPLAVLGQATNSFVPPLAPQFVALLGAAASLGVVFAIPAVHTKLDHHMQPTQAAAWAVLRWIALIVTVLFVIYIIANIELLRESIVRLDRADPARLAALTSLSAADLVRRVLVWPQVFTVILGTTLLGLAFLVWMTATRRETTPGTLTSIATAILLMVGGWLFIGQLPEAAARGDPQFYQALLRTATYALMTVPVQLSLGLLLAYLLFYEVRRGKSLYRVVFFIPYVAPTVATAAVFAVIFSLDPQSPANQIVRYFGIPPQQWLRDTRGIFEIAAQLIGGRQVHLPSFLVGPSLPLLSAIIYSIWVFSGYDSVIFLAGLGNVPYELIEAAQVDGAGRWPVFRHIIFPLVSPTTFFLTMLAIIGTFKAFDYIYVLRQENARGAMDTATVYIFELIRTGSKSWSYASSAAFVLFGIILILTLVQNRLSQDRVFYG
jgi:multiple sugar transport system permease protein